MIALFFRDVKTNFSKQLFAIYNMFGNGSCVFQNNLPDHGFALDPPWTLQPPASFSVFQVLATLTPAYIIMEITFPTETTQKTEAKL